jgi:response regulator RpfG family c-di-GMP phosphodiesterase
MEASNFCELIVRQQRMSTTLMSTILVVEDTLSELELMSHYLREGGYTVINAIGAKKLSIRFQNKSRMSSLLM